MIFRSRHTPAALFDLDEVLERVTDGIVVCDRDDRFVYANASAERLLGLRRDVLVGQSLFDVYPHMRADGEPLLREVVRTGKPAEYTKEHPPSGRCFRHTIYPGPNGGTVIYFRDITAKRDATAALQTNESRYRTLFESMDEGFCVVEVLFDRAGRAVDYVFLEVNPSFERQTGLHDAVGQRMRELVPGHEEHWYRIYGDVAKTGVAVRFENRAEALQRWYDVYAFRVGEPEQHTVAVLFNDVSPRKQAEQALQEADRNKDEFLATLAHELRNPLAPLRNGLQIVRLSKGNTKVADRFLDMMERQVGQMVSMIDELLDVSRIRRGHIAMDRQRVDLVDVVHQALEVAEPAMRQRGHELALQLPPGELCVDGDRMRLSQVLANLLLNAAKYTDPGGHIALEAHQDGERAVVSIVDDGVGIPPEMLGKVFEPFTQVDTGFRGQGGLGLGLTIVKRLVEMHGGTVDATSAGPGHGSTFTVALPLAAADSGYGMVVMSGGAAPATRRTVLVGDDNRDAADSLAVMLQLLGHEVHVAFDGAQAVEMAEQHHPDIVLLDLDMPRLDGLEAARRIRAQAWAQSAVLVAVTGWAQDGDHSASKQAGFDHHLVKPIDFQSLEKIFAEMKPE